MELTTLPSKAACVPEGEQAPALGTESLDINEILDVFGIDVLSMLLATILINKQIFILDSFDVYHQLDQIIQFLKEVGAGEIPVSVLRVDEGNLKTVQKDKAAAFIVSLLYGAVLKSPFKQKANFALEAGIIKDAADLPDRQAQVAFLRLELAKITKIADEILAFLKKTSTFYDEDLPDYLLKNYSYKLPAKAVPSFKELLAVRGGDEKVVRKMKSKYADLGFVSS
jgi:hypothetical protein